MVSPGVPVASSDGGPSPTSLTAMTLQLRFQSDVDSRALRHVLPSGLADRDNLPNDVVNAGRVFPGVDYRDDGDMTLMVCSPFRSRDDPKLLAALNAAGGWPSPAGVLQAQCWEYVVGGDCEGDEPPAVYGHSSKHLGLTYESNNGPARRG